MLGVLSVGLEGDDVSDSTNCNEKCSIKGCEGHCDRVPGHRSYHACKDHDDEE